MSKIATVIASQVNAFCAADAAQGAAVDALRKALAGKDASQVRAAVIGPVCAYYKVPLVEGQRKAKGTMVPDKDAPEYPNAKRKLSRLVAAIIGDASKSAGDKAEYDIPEDVLKAAQKLVALCAEYEDAKRLAAQAVAKAFAK